MNISSLILAAGVDMSSPEPVEKAIDYFEGLLDQIEKLMKK